MAKHPEDKNMPPTSNGALFDSHEYRIQRVEAQTSELMSQTASNGVKLENISQTVQGIDGKLDGFSASLKEHVDAEAKIHLKVHDLEQESKVRKEGGKNQQYFFWTAMAALAAEVVMRLLEHAKLLTGGH